MSDEVKKCFASGGEAHLHPGLAWVSTLVKFDWRSRNHNQTKHNWVVDPSKGLRTSTLISMCLTSCPTYISPRQEIICMHLRATVPLDWGDALKCHMWLGKMVSRCQTTMYSGSCVSFWQGTGINNTPKICNVSSLITLCFWYWCQYSPSSDIFLSESNVWHDDLHEDILAMTIGAFTQYSI